MVFVDGENLVFRFQEMLKQGFRPVNEVVHEPDVFVWLPWFTQIGLHHEILRVNYYTYVVGDNKRIENVGNIIRRQTFSRHEASLLPNALTPCIFKKENKSRSVKGVDIKLSVDMLSHVFRGNVDSVLLLSGDGDYVPLLEEVRRAGVLVFVSAFSSGFNSALRDCADTVFILDGGVWIPT